MAGERQNRTVDFHAHAVPDSFRREMAKLGIDPLEEDGFPVPDWNGEDHLAWMDQAGIDLSVLSISSPHLYSGDDGKAKDAARAVNDAMAQVCREHPGRFRFAASLPLPCVDGALEETARAMDELGAAGVKVATNMGGVYLGDPALDALMEELDRRKALVILHPARARERPVNVITGGIAPMFEYPADTTRAVLNLIAHRTITRFPGIRFVVPHCGSFLPYMLQRFIGISQVLSASGRMEPVDARAEFDGLWFDIAGDAQPAALKSLLLVASRERLVYGSDYPYTPGAVVLRKKQELEAAEGPLMGQICGENACALLPEAGEYAGQG